MGKKFEVFDPKQWNSIVFKVFDQSAAVVSHEEQVVESEEMHENTEEIDALLYSESNESHEQHEQDECEASTGHSPLDLDGTHGYKFKTKRRRLDTELMDTASSRAREDESSCIGEEQECNKKSKRKRIQDTVEVLRRIIPGLTGVNGKAKDAAAVLDEAIRYLNSLKLRMKGLEFITD